MNLNHLDSRATVAETAEITKEVSGKIIAAGITDQFLTDENTLMNANSVQMLKGIGTPKGKALSDQYFAADALRDNLLFVLITLTDGYMAWEHEPTQAAANVLGKILKAHGKGIARKSYEVESALLTSILTELATPIAAQAITTLGLTVLVAELRAAQENFISLTSESATIEAVNAGKVTPTSIRKQTINNLNSIIDYLNLMLRNEGRRETYSQLSSEIGILVNTLNLKISNRTDKKELIENEAKK